MKTYRVGMLGAGFMGRTHAWCWKSLPFFYTGLDFRVDLAGIVTSRPETAEKARDEFGVTSVYLSPQSMIEAADIDVIDIATPNHLHAEAVLSAAEAGKPVYCDKPLTGTLETALHLERQIPSLGSVGQMVFHNRFFPATMRARQLVEEGQIGEVICFRAEYLHSGNVAPGKRMAWKDRADYGAGVLYDLGSHLVDLVTWLCGCGISTVSAQQKTLHRLRPSMEDPGVMAEQTTDDMTQMLVTLHNGAFGSMECSKIATGMQDELRFELHGTKGALRFNLMEPNWLHWFDAADPELPLGGTSGFRRIHCVQRYDPPGGFPTPKASIGWLRGHLHCLYTFIHAVHTSAAFDPSLARGVQVEKWLAAVRQASETGRCVTVP